MANAKTNPLNAFVGQSPSTNTVKLPELPNIHALVTEHGFTTGLLKYDEQMREHSQKVEQIINERTQGKSAVSSGNP